jgi:hypothetical protein
VQGVQMTDGGGSYEGSTAVLCAYAV